MGKYLLLIVAASVLGANTLLMTGAGVSTAASRADVSATLAGSTANQLAYTGMNEAAQWLASLTAVPAATTLVGTGADGAYRTTVTPVVGLPRVTVRTVGTTSWLGGPASGIATAVTRTLEAVFELGSGSGAPDPTGAVPEFMQAALTQQNLFTANGNVRILSSDPEANANVRTNSAAQVNNSNNRFTGFLFHGQPINDAGIRSRVSAAFVPNVNPNNDPNLQLTAAVSIPSFNAYDYRTLATRTTNGNQFLSGTVQLGTLTSPTIWYVSGELIMQGSAVTFQGYGVFLVNGNVNVSTNATVSGAAAGTSGVGILASGVVNMNAALTLNGYILARGNINFSSSSTVYGSVTSGGMVNFNNGGLIVSRTPPSELLPMYPQAPTALLQFRPISLRVTT